MNPWKRKEVIGDCTLFLGDCLEVMRGLPPCFKVDAVVTDPPFGVGNFIQQTGNKRGPRVEWNEAGPSKEYFEEIKRISKHRVIWGANYFNCFEGKGGFVWVKNQPMPDFSKAEMASTSWGAKVELFEFSWAGGSAKKETKHPCERPPEIYEWSIKQIPGNPQVILDTYLGSGSCGVACVRLGLKFMGIEKNPEYFDWACERIINAYRQERLFA